MLPCTCSYVLHIYTLFYYRYLHIVCLLGFLHVICFGNVCCVCFSVLCFRYVYCVLDIYFMV